MTSECHKIFSLLIMICYNLIMNNTANILKSLRIQSNMSQAELAELIGISRSAISSYENGTRSPNHDTLVKFATIFNVSTDYLLGLTNENDKLDEITQVFSEIRILLESSNLNIEKRSQILTEIKDYFHWKLNKAKSK